MLDVSFLDNLAVSPIVRNPSTVWQPWSAAQPKSLDAFSGDVVYRRWQRLLVCRTRWTLGSSKIWMGWMRQAFWTQAARKSQASQLRMCLCRRCPAWLHSGHRCRPPPSAASPMEEGMQVWCSWQDSRPICRRFRPPAQPRQVQARRTCRRYHSRCRRRRRCRRTVALASDPTQVGAGGSALLRSTPVPRCMPLGIESSTAVAAAPALASAALQTEVFLHLCIVGDLASSRHEEYRPKIESWERRSSEPAYLSPSSPDPDRSSPTEGRTGSSLQPTRPSPENGLPLRGLAIDKSSGIQRRRSLRRGGSARVSRPDLF